MLGAPPAPCRFQRYGTGTGGCPRACCSTRVPGFMAFPGSDSRCIPPDTEVSDGAVSVCRNILKEVREKANRDLGFSREEVEKLKEYKPPWPDVIYPKVSLARSQYFLDLRSRSAIYPKLLRAFKIYICEFETVLI